MKDRPQLTFVTVLVVCAIASHVLSGGADPHIPALNSYYYDVLIGIGINIILAAGLNLVNGYTGQFSLGHAGFMAAGAYASSYLTLLYGYSLGTSAIGTTGVFILALIIFFLIVEPHGLARLWAIAKEKLRLWPFPH